MKHLFFLFLLLLSIVFEVVADVSFKCSHLQSKQIWLWLGIGLYTIGTIIWAFSLRYEYLSKAISIFTVLNLISVVLAGFIFFHEEIPMINKLGIGLGIAGVILMQM